MFEIKKWYQYKLKNNKKNYIGQCINISEFFVNFHIGFETKDDCTIENQHMVDLSIIEKYEMLENHNIEMKSIKNIDRYKRIW